VFSEFSARHQKQPSPFVGGKFKRRMICHDLDNGSCQA
jgi:hypothetical protein